jgi:hypothetical protein
MSCFFYYQSFNDMIDSNFLWDQTSTIKTREYNITLSLEGQDEIHYERTQLSRFLNLLQRGSAKTHHIYKFNVY